MGFIFIVHVSTNNWEYKLHVGLYKIVTMHRPLVFLIHWGKGSLHCRLSSQSWFSLEIVSSPLLWEECWVDATVGSLIHCPDPQPPSLSVLSLLHGTSQVLSPGGVPAGCHTELIEWPTGPLCPQEMLCSYLALCMFILEHCCPNVIFMKPCPRILLVSNVYISCRSSNSVN